MLKNKSYPQVVPSLEGLFIEDVAVGCEHVLALSSTGDIYAWGCNSEGQVTNILCYKIIHFDILKFALSAHQKSCIVGVCVCVPAWSWTLQPSEGTHAHNSPPGEEHQTDICWPLPQFCMDHPFYLDEKLRYTCSLTAHVHMHDSWKRIHSHLLLSSLGGPGNFQLGLPQSVPPQYNTLKDCSPDVLSVRLRVLYNFSDLMYKSWRLLNLDPKNPVISDPFFSGILNISKDQIINDWLSSLFLTIILSLWCLIYFPPILYFVLPSIQVSTSRYSSGTTAIIRGELRGLLSPKVNTLPLVRSIGKTMTQGKTYGPQITVKRISTR